jgi:acetyl-CoA acyltransferase
MKTSTTRNKRAAIIAGRRTPFVRAGTGLADVDVYELGRAATVELLQRSELDPKEIDHIVFGNVVRPVKYSNLAREIGLSNGVPRSTPAFTVSLACASSCQAFTSGVDLVERGYADTVLTGGAESLSNAQISYSPKLARALVGASQAKTATTKIQSFAQIRLKDLAPVVPAIAETSTGLTMGESAELMAKENGIDRRSQDEFALRSHQNAAKAAKECRLSAEVAPFFRADGRAVSEDNHIRTDSTLEKLHSLRPVFDRAHGSVTAGNSSPLTDGAAAVLIMSGKKARALGYTPKAWVRSYAYAGIDPRDQLLLAPAYAIPIALDRAGLTLSDIDLVEMHEAFAAQVLSTTQALASQTFASEKLGRSEALGEIDPAILNVNGGSIALGHPFGATGARVISSLANEMERRNVQFGLISVCAAGGLGCAIVLER